MADRPLHYAGDLQFRSGRTAVTQVGSGFAACCSGDRAYAIRRAGTHTREHWREHGYTCQRVLVGQRTSTVNGSAHPASVWERLRWGTEWTDGESTGGMMGVGLYLHVAALLAGEPEDGERVVYRVRSRLTPGQRVTIVDGTTTQVGVVAGVRLARDPAGAGGWAWLLDLVSVGRWKRDAAARAYTST